MVLTSFKVFAVFSQLSCSFGLLPLLPVSGSKNKNREFCFTVLDCRQNPPVLSRFAQNSSHRLCYSIASARQKDFTDTPRTFFRSSSRFCLSSSLACMVNVMIPLWRPGSGIPLRLNILEPCLVNTVCTSGAWQALSSTSKPIIQMPRFKLSTLLHLL